MTVDIDRRCSILWACSPPVVNVAGRGRFRNEIEAEIQRYCATAENCWVDIVECGRADVPACVDGGCVALLDGGVADSGSDDAAAPE